MPDSFARISQALVLLAINLLYLMIWGFAGISKWMEGPPGWFAEKFGSTFLGKFPGVQASFWMLAVLETLAFVAAGVALLRREFLGARPPLWLMGSLLLSLLIFLQLGFGLWLTKDFNGGFQQFVYFGLTLVAVRQVQIAGSLPSATRP